MTEEALPAFAAYGIELEYMLVDRASLAVRPMADELLKTEAPEASWEVTHGDLGWSQELALHVIEVKNLRPAADLADLAVKFRREVAAVNRRLEPLGARLMPGGAHPWMNPAAETRLWPHAGGEVYRAYDRIFGCRRHGFANLQSMHLNLPFAGDDEFARLHAAMRLVLPILPSLAASSPIIGGTRAAWLDARMAAYQSHQMGYPATQGQVIPDTIGSISEYRDRVLEPMYREIAPADPEGILRHEWLNARGAIPRFDRNAIEIRVIDMQECPMADLAIAAAAIAVIRALYEERPAGLAAQHAMATQTLVAILDACIRDADAALIGDEEYLGLLGWHYGPCRGSELWRHLVHSSPLPRLWEAPLQIMLEHGTLARRILSALGPRPGHFQLDAVYRALCDCLAEGRLFVP